MRRLIRTPLTWMVLAEMIVVAVLVVVAWNMVAAAVRPATAAAAPSASPDVTSADTASPSPDLFPTLAPGGSAPLPGLNLDSAFWRQRLDQLNQDQVFFEQLEWRVIHSAMDAMKRYLETVVVPSVRRAERR